MVAMVSEGDGRTEARKLLDLIHANLLKELEAANQRIADLESQLAVALPAINDAELAEAVERLTCFANLHWNGTGPISDRLGRAVGRILNALAARERERRAWEWLRNLPEFTITSAKMYAATVYWSDQLSTASDPVDAVLLAAEAAKGGGDA
jgi:hypothetical protein